MNPINALDIRTSLTRLAAPSLGLFVFAAMIVRGLCAGNPAQIVLMRALWGLAGGVVLGSVAGSIAHYVIRDRSDQPTSVPGSRTSDGHAVPTGAGVAATGA